MDKTDNVICTKCWHTGRNLQVDLGWNELDAVCKRTALEDSKEQECLGKLQVINKYDLDDINRDIAHDEYIASAGFMKPIYKFQGFVAKEPFTAGAVVGFIFGILTALGVFK